MAFSRRQFLSRVRILTQSFPNRALGSTFRPLFRLLTIRWWHCLWPVQPLLSYRR